jgi:hypothetical protein
VWCLEAGTEPDSYRQYLQQAAIWGSTKMQTNRDNSNNFLSVNCGPSVPYPNRVLKIRMTWQFELRKMTVSMMQ